MAGATPPDDYEKKYMGGEAPLARSRLPMPWWFGAVLALAGGAQVYASVMAHDLLPVALLPLLFVVWILFLYLRVNVTPTHVHVQFGLFGPKIPIAKIIEASVEPYSFGKYGGWGIRFALDGSTAYSVPGHGGRGLRITYEKKNGRRKTVFVSSDKPDELLAAIRRAQTGVRVDDGAYQTGPRVAMGEVVEEEFPADSEDAKGGRSGKSGGGS